MKIEFSGEIWFWRGPAPWFFITVPEQPSGEIKEISNLVTYGWGVIPVRVRIDTPCGEWSQVAKFLQPSANVTNRHRSPGLPVGAVR